jgi:hypothetical protein
MWNPSVGSIKGTASTGQGRCVSRTHVTPLPVHRAWIHFEHGVVAVRRWLAAGVPEQLPVSPTVALLALARPAAPSTGAFSAC